MQKLTRNTRESDGRFALRLESQAAIKREEQRQAAIRSRRAVVEAENAEWAKEHGVDQSELFMLFA